MFNFNDNDKKYIIKRVIAYVIISFLSYFLFAGCVKAQVGSNYINYPINPRIVDFQQGQSSRSFTITNASGNLYEIWGGLSQGYVIFTAATSNGTQGVLTSQLMSIDIASDTRTFHCEMGTIATYIDNTTEMNVYSVKCPVDFSDNHGWKYIIFERNNIYNLLYVHISNVATYVSEISEAAAITSSQQQAANQQITAIQNQALETRAHIDDAANNIVNATQNASVQAHQDSQAIHNDLSSEDSDDTSNRCGVLCKLKSLVNFIKPSNLIHLIVPTQEDWSSVIANANDAITNRLGVVGLVLNVFINCLNILTNNSGLTNYCINWNDIQVPNFNETIIPAGQWCIDTYFQDGVLKSFADVCRVIIGGLTCFAFLGYIQKIYKKILDIPITRDDEYEYISSSNWEMAHVDFNGDNDYQVFGRRSTTTTRKRV